MCPPSLGWLLSPVPALSRSEPPGEVLGVLPSGVRSFLLPRWLCGAQGFFLPGILPFPAPFPLSPCAWIAPSSVSGLRLPSQVAAHSKIPLGIKGCRKPKEALEHFKRAVSSILGRGRQSKAPARPRGRTAALHSPSSPNSGGNAEQSRRAAALPSLPASRILLPERSRPFPAPVRGCPEPGAAPGGALPTLPRL